MEANFIKTAQIQFEYYKKLAEQAMEQVSDEHLFWKPYADTNSIGNIINHLVGNMLSRWTNFLTSDGEKEWRNRDGEFEDFMMNRSDLMAHWNEGWDCLFFSLNSLKDSDLASLVYIRNQGHTVLEAIQRQMTHYPYHIGQIVLICKMQNTSFKSLTIAKGKSAAFNSSKFSEPKQKTHFTEK